jgi:hypothetical protein
MSESTVRYFEAPNYYEPADGDPPAVFLAGGITGCPRWHDDAVDYLRASGVPMVVLNPNRADFPIQDPDAGMEQVSWEQHHLHLPGVITLMWFPASDPTVTTQPIAMFELGQAIGEDRALVVGAHSDYPRAADVDLMMQLHRPAETVRRFLDDLLAATVEAVRRAAAPFRVFSFGYGHGELPDEVKTADLIVDVRDWFRDPHIDPAMRELTGLNAHVAAKVWTTPGVPRFVDSLHRTVATLIDLKVRTVTVAIGCVGGRHRSVVLADRLADRVRVDGWDVDVQHLHVGRPVIRREVT